MALPSPLPAYWGPLMLPGLKGCFTARITAALFFFGIDRCRAEGGGNEMKQQSPKRIPRPGKGPQDGEGPRGGRCTAEQGGAGTAAPPRPGGWYLPAGRPPLSLPTAPPAPGGPGEAGPPSRSRPPPHRGRAAQRGCGTRERPVAKRRGGRGG